MSIERLMEEKPKRFSSLGDAGVASLLFGSKKLYKAFVQAINADTNISEENYQSIVDRVKKLHDDLFYALRQGSVFSRIFVKFLNESVIEEYRRKLRQDPLISHYLRIAESYLKPQQLLKFFL